MRFIPLLLLSFSTIASAAGQGPAGAAASQAASAQPGQINTLSHIPPPPLQEIGGVLSWNVLAQVAQKKSKTGITPVFSKEISDLNGKQVKIQGFMMPLEPGQKQTHFLVSVNAPTCSFCLPAGPEGVVEVKSKTPIKYTFEPVLIGGKLAVLKDDPTGMYYRLTEAGPVPVK